MAILLKGAAAAAAMADETADRANKVRAAGVQPKLAIVRMGERPNNLSYEKSAIKRCEKNGVEWECFTLKEEASQSELEQIIHKINEDDLEVIYNQLNKEEISGLTITGGDPLFQDEKLALFLKEIKLKFPNKDV
jgi:hypothetical protein